MTAIDVVLVAARLAIGCWLLWSVPRLATRPDGRSGQSDLAGVAVVVPARDEALSIGTLLGSLPAGPEVVVVDDDSTDATAAVATAAGARVMRSRPLPAGWVGKTWACAQGVAATTGDPVVLVDADVRFGPGGLAAAVGEQRDRGGLVSVQPFHEPGTPAESLASIFNIVGFAGTDAASPLGRIRGVRGAFGPVLVTSRADLESVGGHEAIRTSVVDDVALAERYRAAGLPVTVLGGGDLVRFRMYPGGFGAMTEGFTKNLAAGAASVRPGTVALVVAWMSLLVQAAVGLGVAVLARRRVARRRVARRRHGALPGGGRAGVVDGSPPRPLRALAGPGVPVVGRAVPGRLRPLGVGHGHRFGQLAGSAGVDASSVTGWLSKRCSR